MTTSTQTLICPLCGTSIHSSGKQCPHCHATCSWQDFARAIDFAGNALADWQSRALLGGVNRQAMEKLLAERRESISPAVAEGKPFPPDTGLPAPTTCWRCARPVAGFYSYCNTCGSPLGEGADRLRYLTYLSSEIVRATGNQLNPAQAHACSTEIHEQTLALRAELERGRLDSKTAPAAPEENVANSYDASDAAPPPLPEMTRNARKPGRSIMEILLDPRSIRWLLASGGGLLTVGVVIWLASLGVFRNTLIVTSCLGLGTAALLVSGCATVKRTRYRLAGRALALLACLVMPINLWVYHHTGLMALDGHLWAAALVCCVLYAITATVLEDPLFVYVLMTGVSLTGMLVLADLHKLAQIAAPATLLVSLGILALHAERAFAKNDGPFSRKRFGMACFWSAQALIGAGLALLLGAQVAAWIPAALASLGQTPMVNVDPAQRILAIGLVLAGAYAWLYSDLVVRRVGIYVYLAAGALIWAGLLTVDVAKLTAHPSELVVALALASLVGNILQAIVMSKPLAADTARLARPLPVLGMVVSVAPVLFGTILHVRATWSDVYIHWPFAVKWTYVAAMLVTAISCAVSAIVHHEKSPRLAGVHVTGAAISVLVGGAGLMTLLGIIAWPVQSAILMGVPMVYLLATKTFQRGAAQTSLAQVAHGAVVVVLCSALFSALNLAHRLQPATGAHTNLLLALLCGEAALFYALAAILHGKEKHIFISSAMACAAGGLLLNFFDAPTEFYCVTFAAMGAVLMIAARLAAPKNLEHPLLVAAMRSANTILSLSFASAVLLTLSRIATERTDWALAGLLGSFVVLSLMCAVASRHSGFRRWYVAVAVIQGMLILVTLQQQIHLSVMQNVEVFCTAAGLVLLVIGYSLWFAEQDAKSNGASACFFFGSLLAGLPLAIAVAANRFWFDISLPDELALATVSVLMFMTGTMCRVRATTLVGGSLLVIHLAMLLVSAGMRAQLAVGIYLAMGGAAIFAVGVLLSIYRENLVKLPKKVREHEGVFGVLGWR